MSITATELKQNLGKYLLLSSKEDIFITKRIREVADLVGIPLIDHIIIGDNKYISMKVRGIL